MLQLGKLLNGGRESKRAVIVSVGEFYPWVNLQRRPGATRDAKKLHKTLSKMGFKVDIHTDLSSDEIYELFHKGRGAGIPPRISLIKQELNSFTFHLLNQTSWLLNDCMQKEISADWAGNVLDF